MRGSKKTVVIGVLVLGIMWQSADAVHSGYEEGQIIDFSGNTLDTSLWELQESRKGIFRQEDGAHFRTFGEDQDYRWANLRLLQPLTEDFQVDVQWRAALKPHWCYFTIGLTAGVEKRKLSVYLDHQDAGKMYYRVTAKREAEDLSPEVKTPTSSKRGFFRFQRKGSTVKVFYQDDKYSEFISLAEVSDFSAGPLSLSLRVESPRGTAVDVSFLQIKINSNLVDSGSSKSLSYSYDESYKIVFQPGNFTEKDFLVAEEGTEITPTGGKKINAGGFIVYTFALPLNLREAFLEADIEGKPLLSFFTPGVTVGLTTHHFFLSDTAQKVPDTSEVYRFKISLPGLTTQNDTLENDVFKLPSKEYLSADNIYFLKIEPEGKETVNLHSLKIESQILSSFVLEPEKTSPVEAMEKGRFSMLGISGIGNANLRENWFGVVPDFSSGIQVFHQIPFLIGDKKNPDESKFLLVNSRKPNAAFLTNKRFEKIHLLHSSRYNSKGEHLIGAYHLIYEDGTVVPIFVTLNWTIGDFASNLGVGSWWGASSLPWANVIRVRAEKSRGETNWRGIYLTSMRNPFPEKVVRAIQIMNDTTWVDLGVFGITLETSSIPEGNVIPSRASFYTGENVILDIYGRNLTWPGLLEGQTYLQKGDRRYGTGSAALHVTSKGDGFVRKKVSLSEPIDMNPGPARFLFEAKDALFTSDFLGFMGAPGEKSFFLEMICGGLGSNTLGQYYRMYALGYDAVRFLLWWPWIEKEPGKYDFSKWDEGFSKIRSAGLAVTIRGNVKAGAIPTFAYDTENPMLDNTGEIIRPYAPKKQEITFPDICDPRYREAVKNFYKAVFSYANDKPYIKSVDTNYGIGYQASLRNDRWPGKGKYARKAYQNYLREKMSLEEYKKLVKRNFTSWEEVDIPGSEGEAGEEAWKIYINFRQSVVDSLLEETVKGIKAVNSTTAPLFLSGGASNLFDANRGGWYTDSHIKIAKKYGLHLSDEGGELFQDSFPVSSLSRRLGIPWQDEIAQTPPIHENVVYAAAHTMGRCGLSLAYCQWYRDSVQNLAYLKPYLELLANSQSLLDNLDVFISFEGVKRASPLIYTEEALRQIASPMTETFVKLVDLNINAGAEADFIDEPLTPARVLLDCNNYLIDPKNIGRLREFLNNGGTFITLSETDKLGDYRVLKEIGNVSVQKYDGEVTFKDETFRTKGIAFKGTGLRPLASWADGSIACGVKAVGKGRIIMVGFPLPHQSMREIFKMAGVQFMVEVEPENVEVWPFAGLDNDYYLLVFNKNYCMKEVSVRFKKTSKLKNVIDCNQETPIPFEEDDRQVSFVISVPGIEVTLIRLTKM